jgi:2-polyprenyl-6-methoxyphenol hydroxylase-like FAD-dependent oxidoreductase
LTPPGGGFSTIIVSGELLREYVGADGIHSAVRHQLYPAEGEPRFTQQMLWRSAVEAEPFLDGQTNQRIIVWVANWQLWHKSPLWCSLA